MDHQPQLDTANPDNFATVQGDVPNSHIPADQTAIGPSLVGNLSADSSIPDGSSIDHDALLFSQQQNDLISHADSGAAHHGLRTVGPSLNPIQPTVIDSQQHSSALESSEPVMHAAADGTFANSAAATTTSEPISVTSEAFSFQSPSPLQQQNSFDRSNPAVVPGELAIQESNTATYSNISHGTEGHQLDPTVLTPFLQRPKSRELENFNSEEDSNATAAEYGTSSEQSAAFYESTAPHGNNYEPIYASPLHATSNNAPNSRMARVLSHGKDSGRLSGTYVAAQHDSKPRSRFNTRAVCGCIFGAKLALSVLLAIAAIGVQIFWIYEMHRVAPGYVPPEPVPVFELSSPQCSTPSGGLARLEPPDGSFMFGFNLEWNKDLPSRLSQRINGIKPAIFNSFIRISATDFEVDTINWNAQECSFVGSVYQITLIPTVDIEVISKELLYEFAKQMAHVNSLYGTPVLLRFMHEMNGPWIATFGQKPRQFKQAFVTLSSYVHSLTNMTAMVFGPNVGYGYPFGTVMTNASVAGDAVRMANFADLDTDRNGVLDGLDDPYLPYYPGDEYVDWIAMSAYQYYTDPSGQSSLAPLTAFIEPTSQASMIGVDATHDLYNRFAAQRNKPFMLGETGAAFVSALGGAALGGASIDQEAAIKKSWWLAIFATTVSDPAKRYPKFKAAIWFEESKAEESYVDRSQVTKDYYITRNPVIANQFVQDAQAVSILWANNLNVTCAGQLVIR